MKYNVEFIVCFIDRTWETVSMVMDEDIVCQGDEEMIFHAMNHCLRPFSEDNENHVCYYGVYYFEQEDEGDDWDDTGTLTSYDTGEDNE